MKEHGTLAQVGKALKVDPKTVRRMIARGELPAVKVGVRRPGSVRDTRPIRIPLEAVDAILEPINVRQGAADAAEHAAR